MRVADLHKLDDEALGQALAQAFAALPEAGPARLALVRDRLPLTTKPASSNRWAQLILIGILSGSGLAAAWWGIETLFFAQTPVEPAAKKASPATVGLPPVSDKKTTSIKQEKSHETIESVPLKQQDESPVIYKHERY
jgi:hypothetical protein